MLDDDEVSGLTAEATPSTPTKPGETFSQGRLERIVKDRLDRQKKQLEDKFKIALENETLALKTELSQFREGKFREKFTQACLQANAIPDAVELLYGALKSQVEEVSDEEMALTISNYLQQRPFLLAAQNAMGGAGSRAPVSIVKTETDLKTAEGRASHILRRTRG